MCRSSRSPLQGEAAAACARVAPTTCTSSRDFALPPGVLWGGKGGVKGGLQVRWDVEVEGFKGEGATTGAENCQVAQIGKSNRFVPREQQVGPGKLNLEPANNR